MSNVFSNDLYHQQESISITRNLTEEQQKTAPLISLADKVQLQDMEPALKTHGRRVDTFRRRVAANLPPALDSATVGNVSETASARVVSEKYISATSGYNIGELENDLLTRWKYQRYNGQDTEDMIRLKDDLKDLTSTLSAKVSFSSIEDIKEMSASLRGKYETLIRSCEHYLETHQSPRSIAGKARKDMANKLIAASYAELDMIEDSAVCCYQEATEYSKKDTASFTWNEILHEGRLRRVEVGQKVNPVEYVNEHRIELRHTDSNERDLISVARDEYDLKECRKVVAMSRLADKLHCGELSGSGSMSTRMTTMIVRGEGVTGVITSGITKTSAKAFKSRQTVARPGQGAIGEPVVVKGTDYQFDEMKLKLLDYLSGVKTRKDTEFAADKEQTSGFLILKSIQATGESAVDGSFGTDPVTMPSLQGATIDQEFADLILSLKAEELPSLFFGMLDESQINGVAERLITLKAEIEEHRESFKTRETVEQEVAAATKRELKLPEQGKLIPLKSLAGQVVQAKGKNASELDGISQNFAMCIEQFAALRDKAVDFSKGKEDVVAQVERQLLAIEDLQDFCRVYMKQSKDDDDAGNRFTVSKILAASEHQAEYYRRHVEEVCDWYQKTSEAFPEWSLSLTYEDLFREAMVSANNIGSTGEFSEDEMYKSVGLSMEDLCERTETDSIESIESYLDTSMKKKVEKGDTNSPEIEQLHDTLVNLKKAMEHSPEGRKSELAIRLQQLREDCQAYKDKQRSGKLPKGLFSGRGRMNMLDQIDRLFSEEFSLLGTFNEEGVFVYNEKNLDFYKRRAAAYLGIPKAEVTNGDIIYQIKMGHLLGIEKDLLRGVKRKKLVEESKEVEKKAKESSKTRKKKEAGDKPEPEDPKVMEKRLSDPLKQKGLHEISASLGFELLKKKKNGAEISRYATVLQQLVEYKDKPIFSALDCKDYAKTKKLDLGIQNRLVGRFNGMAEQFNVLTDIQDRYFERMSKKLFGGVSSFTGSARQELISSAYKTYHWEFEQFLGTDYKGEKRIMPEPLLKALQEVLDSGIPLSEVTLTDITNRARLNATSKTGTKKGSKK